MDVTILGTGSALPSPDRVQSGILIEEGDRTLLVDCGSGTLHRLAQTDVDLEAVDTVLLTHHHLDHVADLPSIIKARILSGYDEFEIVGPPGTGDIVDPLLAVDDLNDRADITVEELSSREFDLSGFDVKGYETRHSKQCFAYRIDDRLAISGDTEPFEGLIEFVDGVDALIHECAYPDDVDADGHTTPTELGELLAGRAIDHVYLTHLFPEAESRATELESAVERSFDGAVTVATDLTTISL